MEKNEKTNQKEGNAISVETTEPKMLSFLTETCFSALAISKALVAVLAKQLPNVDENEFIEEISREADAIMRELVEEFRRKNK